MISGTLKQGLLLTATLGTAAALSACPFCHQVRDYVVGDVMDMGNGSVRSWLHTDKNGMPDAIGITFTETALDGLPRDLPDNGMIGYEFTLKLPKEASFLPFNHIGIDWNPKGHIPPGIYDVPHFDFHFYMLTHEERMKIDTVGEGMKLCQKKPKPEFLPKNYMYAPGSEFKYMGSHWIDTNTPELHGKPFTETFIYGSYNGKVAFMEPMVAMEFLKGRPDVSRPIPQPGKYSVSGKTYPTRYHIAYNAARHEYMIVLDGFVKGLSTTLNTAPLPAYKLR